jgi:hypothetical protein
MSVAPCVEFGVGVFLRVGEHRLEHAIAHREVAVGRAKQTFRPASEFSDLVIGQSSSTLERLRTFEGRSGMNQPDAL